jgi:hypothetical protein
MIHFKEFSRNNVLTGARNKGKKEGKINSQGICLRRLRLSTPHKHRRRQQVREPI